MVPLIHWCCGSLQVNEATELLQEVNAALHAAPEQPQHGDADGGPQQQQQQAVSNGSAQLFPARPNREVLAPDRAMLALIQVEVSALEAGLAWCRCVGSKTLW